MKRIPLILFLLSVCTTHIVTAQPARRDSLKQILRNEKDDTSRVLLLAKLSQEYMRSSPDTMLMLALEGLNLSRRNGFLRGEAQSLTRAGTAYGLMGNYPKAMELFLQSVQLNEKTGDLDYMHINLNSLGMIYYAQGDYRTSLQCVLRARDIAGKVQNNRALVVTMMNIADNYNLLMIYDSAKLFISQAIGMASRLNNIELLAATTNILGNTYAGTGNYNLALEQYRLSCYYALQEDGRLPLISNFLGMSCTFQKMNREDSAVLYAKKALQYARQNGFAKELSESAKFLANHYKVKKNADSAFVYADIAKVSDDSLFNIQKVKQLQSLAFEEKLRQEELIRTIKKAKEKRQHKVQYAGIAAGLLIIIILFLLFSHSIIVSLSLIRFLGILSLLIFFEFIDLLLHPFLGDFTHHSPVLMLAFMVSIAALLIIGVKSTARFNKLMVTIKLTV
ncbi:MAG: tetratricopeptide repeat protein, partial [Chitinophagaceae bacterium]